MYKSDLYQSELLYISIHLSIYSCVYLTSGPMFRSIYSTLTIPLSVECAGLVMPTACVYLFSTAASFIFAPLPHPSTSSIDWCGTRLEPPSHTPITMIQNILHPLKVNFPPPTLLNSCCRMHDCRICETVTNHAPSVRVSVLARLSHVK